MKSLHASVLVILFLCGTGCSVFGPKKPDIPEATLPAWLGRVVMVDAVHRFVLVDAGAMAVPPAGSLVVTLREKRRTGLLQVTEDARPPYVAMEIIEGDPALGDQAALDETKETPAASPTDS